MCLGIIGGLGPMASAYFLELIVAMTESRHDQDHPKIALIQAPSIPDRTAYITGKSSENPVVPMIQAGMQLKIMGATAIAIPCITAHYFHQELETAIGLPVIHAIRCCAKYIHSKGIKKVGLMATDGTIYSRLFQKELESVGIDMILPSLSMQAAVMSLIYDGIKAGNRPNIQHFNAVHRELQRSGAEITLLGCTELSLLKSHQNLGENIIDSLEILARECVVLCGKTVKPEYADPFPHIGHKEQEYAADKCIGVFGKNGPTIPGQNGIFKR